MTIIKQTKFRLKLFLFLLLFTSALTFTLLSCGDNITGPEQPGKRNYTWTVDTLSNPFDPLFRLWGSSPTDVWSINISGNVTGEIFHFDGKKWSSDAVPGMDSPHSIYGFASNNLWIGAAQGQIWHYGGNIWKQAAKLTKDGNTQIVFDNMWGDSPNDLYAFGAYTDENGFFNNSAIAHSFTNIIKGIILSFTALSGINIGQLSA